MDNDYRKQWDKTVVEHEQLQVDKINGVEIGRTKGKVSTLDTERIRVSLEIVGGGG